MQPYNFDKTRKLTITAMLLAAAFILSWIERVVEIPIIVPGIKLGLANIVIMFTMCTCGKKEALMVLTGRLILNALLFGNFLSLIYSVTGGFLSFAIMCVAMNLFKIQSITVVSICGGVFHNIGQLMAACIVMKSFAVLSYLPYLIIGGIVTGALNGLIVRKISVFKIFEKRDTKIVK
ncbi:MAG: Gx transporter family protein [Acutalibacteraceae bacterium]|nr:Gx transporter family protein [Acutalibacteraceae bacterium]